MPPEVAHESSGALHDAVFSLGAPGEVATAWNDEKGAFFVVEYVDFVAPDPGGFKLQRGKVESEMLRDRHNQFFTQWKKRVYVDAGLGPIRSDSEAAGG